MTSFSLPRLLTAEEVGRILRLKPATVYEAAAAGRIPCVRLWRGRRKSLIRFRGEEIEALIRERSLPTGSGLREDER
jgi:excisionase family DNA binding protein